MSLATVDVASADGALSASFAPQAGMVCCSLSLRGEQLLDPRRGLDTYARAGKTMGIPLLYPWANRLGAWAYRAAAREVNLSAHADLVPSEEHELPIHGVLPGLMRWRAEAAGSRLSARLDWEDQRLLELFPFRHEVLLEATAGRRQLTLAVTVTASLGDPVPVSFGFHPYLRLPADPGQCELELPEAQRIDVDDQAVPTGGRSPLPRRSFGLREREWDDGLELASSPARFSIAGEGRRVTVELREGYPFGQVFAPAEAGFVCFEPMSAPADALRSGDGLRVLEPGEQHRAEFAVILDGF